MKKFALDTLESQLCLIFLLLLLLPTSLLGWLAYIHAIDRTMSERIKVVGRISDAKHEQLTMAFQRAIDRTAGFLEDLGRSCSGPARTPECFSQKMNSYMHSERALGVAIDGLGSALFIVGNSAVEGATIPAFKSGQLAQFPKKTLKKNRHYFIAVDAPHEDLRVAITYPVSILQPIFTPHIDLGHSGETFLADAEGFFITDARYPSAQGHSHPISATPMQRCLSPENAETLDIDYRNVPIIHGFRFVPEIGGGCIMAHIDQAEAFAPLETMRNRWIAALPIFAVISLFVAKFISRRIGRPIRQLTQVAHTIAAGNRSVRAVPTGFQDVVDLASAFNAMTDQLVEANAHLEQRVLDRTESLRLMSSVFQGSGEGICITDIDNKIIAVNRSFIEMTGYSAAEAIGQNPKLLASGKTPKETYEHMWWALESNGYWQGEVLDKHKDGRIFPIWLAITAVRDEQHRTINYFGSFNDITQRKLAEDALRDGHEALRSILETTLDGYWRIDGQSHLLDVNDAYCRQSGYTREELLTMKIPDLEANETSEETVAHIQLLIESGCQLFESRHRRKDGSIWHVEISATYRRFAGGQFFVFLRDISERKRAEAELLASAEQVSAAERSAKEHAEAANRAKSAFLSNMSHEIRSPLNALLGLTEMVLRTELNRHQRDMLKIVHTSGATLLHLLNDILDFSKIEAGHLRIEQASFELETLIATQRDMFHALAEAKKLVLRTEIAPDTPFKLLGDSLRLTQVLSNLLGNAIKFTAHGEVSLKIDIDTAATCREDVVALRFTVRDTGIGMTTEQIARIFQPFVQADVSTSRQFGGTGLGLAISQNLVNLMGGELIVDSVPGQGSCFVFSAPLSILQRYADATTRTTAEPALSLPLSIPETPAPRAPGWSDDLRAALRELKSILRERELTPRELLQTLQRLEETDLPGKPVARLVAQIDLFDYDQALRTLAELEDLPIA